jgi:hypothetical protein
VTDPKNIKVEESGEIRMKRRVRIMEEFFGPADCKVSSEPQFDDEGWVGDVVMVKRLVYGKETPIVYIDSKVRRGERHDEIHVQYASQEPVVLDAVARFIDAGLGKLRYDMNEIVVIAHYERPKDKTDDAYTEMVRTSGRVTAVQRTMARLEEEVGQKVKEA